MKKILCGTLAVMLALGFLGCGKPTDAAPAPAAEAVITASEVVVFADPVLEQMVRAGMGKPEGGITAAEAEAVTRLNLSIGWQRYISGETSIQDIGGLEYFKNLKSLDLSFHAITDVTPLAGLKKLTSLSLGGNAIADLAPLAELTNLKVLVLSNCAAQDYGPLAALVNLEFLMLDHSTIADVSPLASLTSLKYLYLAECPLTDYSPLSNVYPSLAEKDFIMASTLAELGFVKSDADHKAYYGDVQRDGLSVNINHAEWGAPQSEDMTKCVRMDLMLDSGYTLVVLYYPEISAYVFQMNINGEQMNYIYNAADGTFMVDSKNRERFERMITEALGETNAEDILLAPIPVFNDTIQSTFGMTADALYALPFDQAAAQPEQTAPAYALPFAPPSLRSLGFVPDEEGNAAYKYDEKEPHDMHISIYRPEWGVSSDNRSIEFYDDDVNGYSLLILYFADEGKYSISLHKNGEACGFDDYPATGEKGWESPDLDTVHRMFNAAFDTQDDGFYDKPLAYLEQAVWERFGMSIDELYALPGGE